METFEQDRANQLFHNCVNLPPICFFEHESDGLCFIVRGEEGYTPVEAATATAADLNAQLNVTPQEAAAMLNGSMFGFHVPAANPQHPANLIVGGLS